MIKGLFNKVQIEQFLYPLKVLSKILDPKDDGGVILNFDSKTKSVAIYTKKQSQGMYIFIKYFDLFDAFQIDDEKIGIIKISDFINYFSVIDDNNTEISFSDNVFYIKDDSSEINFKTADISNIAEGPKNLKTPIWLSEIKYDSSFDRFEKAMKMFTNEDHIYMTGKSSENKIDFLVRKVDLDNNKFKCSVSSQTKDFEMLVKKQLLQTAIDVKSNDIMIKVAERFISVESKTDYFSINFFIAKSLPT